MSQLKPSIRATHDNEAASEIPVVDEEEDSEFPRLFPGTEGRLLEVRVQRESEADQSEGDVAGQGPSRVAAGDLPSHTEDDVINQLEPWRNLADLAAESLPSALPLLTSEEVHEFVNTVIPVTI